MFDFLWTYDLRNYLFAYLFIYLPIYLPIQVIKHELKKHSVRLKVDKIRRRYSTKKLHMLRVK